MSADVLSVSRREGSRDRWLRRVSVRRPQALVAALIALAVSLLLVGSAASQEASDQTERPGTGTATAPAAATDLAIDAWQSPEPGLRLRWTDTNELESGYRVSAGPSLDELTSLGDYPRDTSGVYTADTTDECFEVRVVFGDVVGPAATHCRPESVPEPPSPEILSLGEPIVGEPVTFYVNGMRPAFAFDADSIFWGDGPPLQWRYGEPFIDDETESTTANTHTFGAPGTYEVTVQDSDGQTVTTMVTVRSTPLAGRQELRVPRNVEHFAQRGHVTFSDTNSGEDGYRISVEDDRGRHQGAWLGHTGANATFAPLNDSYSEYSFHSSCIEVRAFKDGVLGPATSSCNNFSPGTGGFFVTDLKPGAEPGELTLQYSTFVGSNMSFGHEIAAVDVDLGWHEYAASPPRCYRIRNERPARSPFDYETGTPGVDLVRTQTVTIDGLTAGRTYAAGFTHHVDQQDHQKWLRDEQVCNRDLNRLSPEVIAP